MLCTTKINCSKLLLKVFDNIFIMAMNQISCWQKHEEDFAKNADVISKSADDNIGYQPVWFIRSPSFIAIIVAKGAFLHFFLQLLSLFLRRTVCLSACVPKLYPHIKSLTTNVKKILVKIINFQHIKICSLSWPGHTLIFDWEYMAE